MTEGDVVRQHGGMWHILTCYVAWFTQQLHVNAYHTATVRMRVVNAYVQTHTSMHDASQIGYRVANREATPVQNV